MTEESRQSLSRRAFMRTSAAVGAGLATSGLAPRDAFGVSGGSRQDVIRVGVIGTGGRGTGAIRDHMRASDNVEIVALGDVMADRLASCRRTIEAAIAEDPTLAPKYKVTEDKCFTGLDAYRQVLDAGIDLVILATPPGFRPQHLAAAVAAGKHIFTEKPVAVDANGIRSVLASYEVARQKGLGVVAGTQRRHDPAYREVISRIHDGAIGDVVGGQVYWNQGTLWHRDPNPEWTDAEWQIRNWLYFTWLSGDHIVEQHVHNIDVANWVMNAHPVKAVAMGGRQQRTGPEFGHIYDHFAVDYEYPNGVHILSMARQQRGAARFVGERFFGTNGRSDASETIEGPNAFKYESDDPSPYMLEHRDLVESIRAGTPLNELRQVAESTLTAIMGREAAYTGREITWDEMLNAEQSLGPAVVAFGPLEVPPVPMPGVTELERGWGE